MVQTEKTLKFFEFSFGGLTLGGSIVVIHHDPVAAKQIAKRRIGREIPNGANDFRLVDEGVIAPGTVAFFWNGDY